MSHFHFWVQNGSDKRELLGNGASPATAPQLLEAGLLFLFNRALYGASVSHTLIKSRHLIDTLCKVLRRWTKRTGLFYSPVDLMVHHLPRDCVRLCVPVCVCVCVYLYMRISMLVYFVSLSVCSPFCITCFTIKMLINNFPVLIWFPFVSRIVRGLKCDTFHLLFVFFM